MSLNDKAIKKEDLPQAFADFFKTKVETIQADIKVEPGVYNGAERLFCGFLFAYKILIFQRKRELWSKLLIYFELF